MNLTARLAAEHRHTRWRARYEGDDGNTTDGVGAVARAFGHTGLPAAYASWLLPLPGMRQLAQLVTGALIAPPHPALRQNGRS